MATEFKTPEEERAYQLGRLDGILYHQQNVMQNLKLQYEKIYAERQKLENSEKKG